MNENNFEADVEAVSDGCPYDELFIYYLKGLADTENRPMGNEFIGNWMEDGFSFLFFSKPSDGIICELIAEQPDLELVDNYTMGYADWLGEKPATFKIGRFTISPPWETVDRFYLPSFGAYHIILDPGVVFGTGTHPTTKDCLELMERAFRNNPLHTLDLGCGTGLLSLAAAKLKCPSVLAVDFNTLAVKTTQTNISLNELDTKITAVQGLAEHYINTEADLLIANIHYEIMEKILGSKGFLQKKYFILSGILNSQAGKVEAALKNLPLDILEHRNSSGVWHTYYGEVRNHLT
ncbi:MAG: 50S ribosomal protein L11 methyltransferase [Desulfobacteraceae bacterium]|jgi:ribosomal protein L11 methyltransferase